MTIPTRSGRLPDTRQRQQTNNLNRHQTNKLNAQKQKRIEFKSNTGAGNKILLTAGKIIGVVLCIVGLTVAVLSAINKAETVYGFAVAIAGGVLAGALMMYGRRASVPTVWIEQSILYVKGGGLPDGYIKCIPLMTVKSIKYSKKHKEYEIECQATLATYDKETHQLVPIDVSKSLEGYDGYTPSLVNAVSQLTKTKVTYI